MNIVLKIITLQSFMLAAAFQIQMVDNPNCAYDTEPTRETRCHNYNSNCYGVYVNTLNCQGGSVISEKFFEQWRSHSYETNSIIFMNSVFYTIPLLAFHELPDLSEIYLNAGGIKSLEAGCFGGLKKLKILQLNGNNIEEIDKGVLRNLFDLSSLNLDNNQLQTIHNDSFKDLINLERLFLGGNKLHSIPNDLFSPLNRIQTIDLSRNYLETLHFSTFHHLAELEYLYINSNRLKYLPPYLFKDLSKLILLDISNNSITNISSGVLSGLDGLTHLNVSHNQLNTVKARSFYFLGNLRKLDVSYNNISYLNTDELSIFLPKLNEVYLHENNWSCGTLLGLIKTLKETYVDVKPGKNYQGENLIGISCSESSTNSSFTSLANGNGGLSTHESDESRFLQNNHILLEIAGKISDNNNLMEQLIHSNLNSSKSIQIIAENVQKNAINAGSSSTSHSPNQNMSNSIERTNSLLENLVNELRIERSDTMSLLQNLTKHSRVHDDPTQPNGVNPQHPPLNENIPLSPPNLEKLISSMKTDTRTILETFMKNISQAIISLQAKSDEPAIPQNTNNQIISEPLQRNSSASKAGDENIGSNLEITKSMTSTKPELELSRTMMETFMKNMSQTIASIQAKINEPAIRQSYHDQIISESLQRNPSVVNSGHGNIGLIVTLCVIVVILMMIMGITYIRYKKGPFTMSGMRRCRTTNRSLANRSDTDLMANSTTLSNSEV